MRGREFYVRVNVVCVWMLCVHECCVRVCECCVRVFTLFRVMLSRGVY